MPVISRNHKKEEYKFMDIDNSGTSFSIETSTGCKVLIAATEHYIEFSSSESSFPMVTSSQMSTLLLQSMQP